MMQSLQQFARYEAYQDSGVEWLGEIPQGWGVKLGFLVWHENKRNNIGMKENQVLSLSYGKIVVKPVEKLVGLVPESFETYQIVEFGDIIIRCMDLQNDKTSLRIGIAEDRGIITSAYLNLKVNQAFCQQFIFYLLYSFDISKAIYKLGTGLRQNLSYLDFKRFKVASPPLAEQTAIANFLDQKTAEIDQAIALKADLIERLKEYKQITIQHAVTRGLDPNAKMKASGVEWIGDIPEGWEITKVKFVTSKIGSGVTPSGGGTIYLETGIPLLRSQNVHFGKVDLDGVAYISEAMHQNMKNSIVLKNDVLLNITGGSIGRCHYSNFDFEMNVNQHVCIVRANAKINYLFLNLFLKSESGQGQIWQNQQGGGREGLNFAALKNFAIHLPPLAEQAAIVAHIETISAKIDQATDQAQQQINTLTEYKTVLINAAVTGKIKVTDDSAQGTRHAQ